MNFTIGCSILDGHQDSPENQSSPAAENYLETDDSFETECEHHNLGGQETRSGDRDGSSCQNEYSENEVDAEEPTCVHTSQRKRHDHDLC